VLNLGSYDASVGSAIAEVNIVIIMVVNKFTIEKRRNEEKHQNTTNGEVQVHVH
jgi:hypothetical protein